MYKHSLSRNQRSRGFKVKQVLQICVLVAVCFWLIYQVKHSHDKKKAFEESDTSTSLESNSRVSKVGGRKDLQNPLQEKPLISDKKDEETEEENGVEEVDSKHEDNVEEGDSKHEENGEEDDSKHEENGEDDDSKHGEEELEKEEDDKNEDKEDDIRGDGDDDIDEHEQEKSEMEKEHEVDVLDEERDKEVNETEEDDTEDKESQSEDASHVEDHDHGAREEHYKGDDASSAVTHESESISAENGRGTLENSVEKAETNGLEDGNVAVNNEKIAVDQNSTNVSEKGEFVVKEEEEYEIVASRQDENPISNSTTIIETTNQEEMGNDLGERTVVTNDTSKMNNSTEAKRDAGEGEISTNPSLNNTQSNSISVNSQNIETSLGESSNSSTPLHPDDVSDDVSGKQKTEESPEEISNENLDSEKQMGESENGEGDLGHHDPIDDSDSSIPLEKDVRTDLDTLPDIRTEGSNDEDAAAEKDF